MTHNNTIKKLIRRSCFLILASTQFGFFWPSTVYNSKTVHTKTTTHSNISGSSWYTKQYQLIRKNVTGLNDRVLQLSLKAYEKAHAKGLTSKQLLTVIDYSLPSTTKRLWVIDLKTGKELFHTWVSHGKNSGGISSTSFSNTPGSLKSSIGVFVTDETYMGGNGYSLRLKGMESGINHNAYNRSVVIHGARYVDQNTIRKYGQIGRSWGCPAVSKDLAKPIINTIKDRTLLFAYYPDKKWLSHSSYLAS